MKLISLEELTADIREKLPRLKELETGCIFIYPTSNNNHYKVTQSCDDMISFRKKNEFSSPRVEYKSVILNKYRIIGKDPMLNDVLEWHSKYYAKNSHFEVFNIVMNNEKHPAGVFLDYSEEDTARFIWDLSKPFLKDQSHELVQFLHGLITK